MNVELIEGVALLCTLLGVSWNLSARLTKIESTLELIKTHIKISL